MASKQNEGYQWLENKMKGICTKEGGQLVSLDRQHTNFFEVYFVLKA